MTLNPYDIYGFGLEQVATHPSVNFWLIDQAKRGGIVFRRRTMLFVIIQPELKMSCHSVQLSYNFQRPFCFISLILLLFHYRKCKIYMVDVFEYENFKFLYKL